MKQKKGQIELAVIKGLAFALGVIGFFLIYEVVTATTPDGTIVECKWDCSDAIWSSCVEGYSYRDINKCIPTEQQCWQTEPKPSSKIQCS